MKIKDIYLGDVDAKHELLKQKRSKSDDFIKSFSLPRQVDIDDFVNGQKYFIFGLKGAGKTALIRYIHNHLRNIDKKSEVILFKSHVSEEDRQGLSRGAGFQILGTGGVSSFTQDFKESWKWMIYQKIAETLKEHRFQGEPVEKLYKLTGVTEVGMSSSLGALFSRIKSGKLNLSGEAFGVAVELGIEGDCKDNSISVSPANANRICAKLLDKVDFGPGLYLLFDELELVHETEDQFNRDRRIIRDLIYVISQINADSTESDRSLFIISTLRSEVLHSILELGHEIGKEIDDFGTKIDWSDASDSPRHPLLKLIARKISISTDIPEEEVWENFFPQTINNQEYYKFILRSSYYRPRDVVRLLRVAREYNDSVGKFSSAHFDETALEFSKQTWLEITEELLATYTPSEISALQRFFLGFNTLFFKSSIENRLRNRYSKDAPVSDLFKKKSVEGVLNDLYRIGVIGNNFYVRNHRGENERRDRWIFRGNATLNDLERMSVHKSLWKHLSLVSGLAP
ncbi:hypothetical protein CP157_03904 (plasmid) [Paracoccus marcusii]|uniref:P-loop ATPase, Sll1717 family n=1 Tax=Paracoccus marcusii TaxID=59779 RepID=UPI001C3DE4BF|nr:hypothetical protein [Paracoccus marcusii]QXI66112.1 hypothetical protein CP157_03904 [Paracoccus marcusii]